MDIKSPSPKVAVIGAGPAGLAASLLLLREGFRVALFESHSKPGGCASYFRRKTSDGRAMTFDAGATVLNGMAPGQWLERALESCGVALPAYEPLGLLRLRLPGEDPRDLDPRDDKTWIASLLGAFPEEAPREAYLAQAARSARLLGELLPRVPHLPLEKLADLRLSLPTLGGALRLAPDLLKGFRRSFAEELDEQGFGPRFRRFVEMQLLITLQAGAESVHPLYGRMALFFYPQGSGNVRGGFKALMDAMLGAVEKHERGHVAMRTPVLSISPSNDGYEIRTEAKRWGPFDHVISTLPRFDTLRLRSEGQAAHAWERHRHECWSANVAYLIVRDHPELPAAPFGAHLSSAPDATDAPGGGDVYVSFSSRGDAERGPAGLRSVTISTHAHPDAWRDVARGTPGYAAAKAAAGAPLVEAFARSFPEVEILVREFATPKTFQRYTRRREGTVGGLPMTYANTFFRSPSQRTGLRNFWQIGDTSFPGQSVYGTAIGAAACVEKILGRKLKI